MAPENNMNRITKALAQTLCGLRNGNKGKDLEKARMAVLHLAGNLKKHEFTLRLQACIYVAYCCNPLFSSAERFNYSQLAAKTFKEYSESEPAAYEDAYHDQIVRELNLEMGVNVNLMLGYPELSGASENEDFDLIRRVEDDTKEMQRVVDDVLGKMEGAKEENVDAGTEARSDAEHVVENKQGHIIGKVEEVQ